MNLRIWSPKIRVPRYAVSERGEGAKDYSGHPDAEGLPKLKSSEGPSMHFWTANHDLLTQKGRTLDSRALPYALQSSWFGLRDSWWLEKVKWLYGAVLSQHTVALRLDARASRVVKDHRSVELSRILQRANALSMSSIHSVTPKHGLSRTRCSNALLHLVPTWCHDFPFFDFFLGGCTIKGFLPPWATSVARRGLWHWGGNFINGNSDQAPFSVDQVQHKNEY